MIVLLMMAGLGVDVGYLKYQKQQMQKAADAGALAAASALIYYGAGNQTQIMNAGQADAAANGFPNGNGITVQVNNPPQTNNDPFVGNNAYVEVIVSQAQPTFFMRLAGYNSVNVSSRAVATSISSGAACVYTLAPNGADSLIIGNGTGAQVSTSCEILVASASDSAISIGNGSTMTTNIGVVGGCNGGECGTLQGDNELTTGIAPFSDPLANLPSPAVPPCQYNGPQTFNNPVTNTIPNGVYCGGIIIATSGTVTFSPGTYYLVGGGLSLQGSPTVSGSGVTFYNTQGNGYSYGPINITGTPTGSLTAATTGDLAGILFYQDRSIPVNYPNSTSNINGSGNGSHGMIYTGTLYFPTTTLIYTGARVINPYELLVAWNLTLLGNTTLFNNYSTLPNGSSPIATATLVE